ncbi:hypothetical protein GBF38_017213, partial [Nibea albiflora]
IGGFAGTGTVREIFTLITGAHTVCPMEHWAQVFQISVGRPTAIINLKHLEDSTGPELPTVLCALHFALASVQRFKGIESFRRIKNVNKSVAELTYFDSRFMCSGCTLCKDSCSSKVEPKCLLSHNGA